MDIRPIKTEADYQAALKEIEGLFDAVPNTPTGDRLEVLTTLVEAYEEQHYPIPSPDPVEAILYHMESRGLTRRDLEPYIGNRARVSEILNRKRSLSLRMIRQLHGGLGIPAEILLQPYGMGGGSRTRRPLRKPLPPNPRLPPTAPRPRPLSTQSRSKRSGRGRGG
jgi:HTH-type transcriptional regulator/antitoxin HigA